MSMASSCVPARAALAINLDLLCSSYRSISDRLILLETRLGRDEEQRSDSPTPSSPPSELEDHFALDLGEPSNPVQVVVEEMSRIEARTGEVNLNDESARQLGNPSDPLLRGLVSVEEVELAFGLYVLDTVGIPYMN